MLGQTYRWTSCCCERWMVQPSKVEFAMATLASDWQFQASLGIGTACTTRSILSWTLVC